MGSELGICLTLGIGVHIVQTAKVQNRVYIWGAVIGIFLGWFYPTANLFYSQCIPRKQEAELAGFFIYCSQILGWFPPLIFSIMVQNNINMKWALTAVASIFLFPYSFYVYAVPGLKSWRKPEQQTLSFSMRTTTRMMTMMRRKTIMILPCPLLIYRVEAS